MIDFSFEKRKNFPFNPIYPTRLIKLDDGISDDTAATIPVL
jgi:hypothetical protein